MAEEEKVISLEDRRRRKVAPPGEPTAPEGAVAKSPAAEHAGSVVEPAGAPLGPIAGRLIWLRCPQCGTLEYTEMAMPGGRMHNRCGTRVEEVSLEIDLRAEFTIAAFNLERLKTLATIVETQRARFLEYQERLQKQLDPRAGSTIVPYPLTEETLKALPVQELEPVLGLLVPKALAAPARHFEKAPEEAAGAKGPAELPPSPMQKPPGSQES